MMKSYTAYCMNEDGENMCMTREYNSKKDFINDLHGNGYKVHFIALTDKYDEESEKYNARRIRRNREAKIRRDSEREYQRRHKELEAKIRAELEAAEEENNEEPTQEVKTMTASRNFFTLEEKTRKCENHSNIVADSDTEYEVKNAPDTESAVKYAMVKYLKKLEAVGTPAAKLLADQVRDYIRFEYFSAANGYNYSGQGGGAFEISVNHLNDETLAIYLRVAEIMEEGEEPEEITEDQNTETSENYAAWVGMIETDVITEEYETMAEAVDEVETRYSKEEMRAAGITFCKLLCNNKQWLECLEEKKIEDIYYFDQGRVIYDERSGNYFRIDSEYNEITRAFWCTMIELDENGDISAELSSGWMTKSEVNRCTDI